jgi:hypothetical protein
MACGLCGGVVAFVGRRRPRCGLGVAVRPRTVEIGVWPVTLLVLVVWCMWDGVGGAHSQKEVWMGYVSQFVEELRHQQPEENCQRLYAVSSVKFCGDVLCVEDVLCVLG